MRNKTPNAMHRNQRQRSVHHTKELEENRARAANKVDETSLSDPLIAACKHLALVCFVSFDQQILSGVATYKVELYDTESSEPNLHLDTKYLTITNCSVEGVDVKFSLSPPHEAYGTLLSIPLVPNKSSQTVTITYATTRQSTAIQWLPPSQTLGKKHPYMFTQVSEAGCRHNGYIHYYKLTHPIRLARLVWFALASLKMRLASIGRSARQSTAEP